VRDRDVRAAWVRKVGSEEWCGLPGVMRGESGRAVAGGEEVVERG
jgi:hypothetical protein